MNITKKLTALLLAVLLLTDCAGPAADPTAPPATEPSSAPEAAKGPYTVSVVTQGGMALPGIDVYVYSDTAMTELAASGATD